MIKITSIKAREVLDSRGQPTLEVTVFSENNFGVFSVPSGASTGSHEAWEKRDGDQSHYEGRGVEMLVQKIEKEITPALVGLDAADQAQIDETLLKLDGTPNKANLGGNTIIGLSVACAKLAAAEAGQEVFEYLRTLKNIKPSRRTPFLFMNLVNGGQHSQSPLAFQEYHIVPQTEDIGEALDLATKIQAGLKKKIVADLGTASANLGDESGYVLDTSDVKKPLELILGTIEENHLLDKIKLSLDVAASSFYQNGIYEFGGQRYTSENLLEFYGSLINSFPIISIEDPFFEEDFASFAKLLAMKQSHVVGDDLTVTNPERLKMAVDQKSIDAIIIKPNQIGTLSETLTTMALARENNIECIISHRSGETNDYFIADLAVAFQCFGLKAGAPSGGERVAKYNRLLEISTK